MTQLIEVKIAELIGPALDWAVAKVEGINSMMLPIRDDSNKEPFALFGSMAFPIGQRDDQQNYSPSTCWHCGGPLIEKYALAFMVNSWPDTDTKWIAVDHERESCEQGSSHLIAACRAIVAAKLGDVVSVPAELVGGDA